jgi:hypothetical protein
MLGYQGFLCSFPATAAAFLACALLVSVAAGWSGSTSADPVGRAEVRHDADVFTASVLLNLTGYDEENADSFHPVRERVRRQMAEGVPAELLAELEGFRSSHPQHHTRYVIFALSTEGPPSFGLREVEAMAPGEGGAGAEWQEVWHSEVTRLRRDLAGLELLLAELWAAPAVPRAFQEAEHEALESGRPRTSAINRGIEAAIAYLKADPSHLRLKQVIIPNLLMSHRQAMGVPMGGATFITVEGPLDVNLGPAGPEPIGDPHEFLHILVAPATRAPDLVEAYPERFGALFRQAMTYPRMQGSYRSHEAWVDECLVKAVACRLVYDAGRPLAPIDDPACPLAVHETVTGYLLEAWFYDKLGTYEQGDMSFAEWFRQTVEATTEEAVLEQLQALGIAVNEP